MTLFIALPDPVSAASAAGPALRYAVSSDGVSLARRGEQSLAGLAAGIEGAANQPAIAVVPAAALSWHRVTLPQLPRSTRPARLRAVLEGLVEERVLDAAAALHLALEPGVLADAAAPREAWLACCDKSWLTGQLQQLERHGLRVRRVVPAAWPRSAQADAEGLLTVEGLGERRQAWLQVCGPQGVWRRPVHAPDELARAWSGPLERLEATPEVAELGPSWRQLAPRLRPAEQDWLHGVAAGWDLAQFELRQGSLERARRRAGLAAGRFLREPSWRFARVGLLLLLATQLAALNGWAWLQRQELQARRDTVRQLLLAGLPATRVVVDARTQLARGVRQMRQDCGRAAADDLESLLQALAGAVPAGRQVQRIDYQHGELRVDGLGLDAADAALAQDRLARHGLRLRPAAAAGAASGPQALADPIPQRWTLNLAEAP